MDRPSTVSKRACVAGIVAAATGALPGIGRAQQYVPQKQEDPNAVEHVTVRSKPQPRSASDWEVDEETLSAAPHETAADVLDVVPGVFVSERGLLGRAPQLSMRGFEGTSGQDVEIFVDDVPMNQVSNIRSPGYADMRLVMPEVVKGVRVSHGPYDPRQGDFAIAGSVHMDLGLEEPGFVSKGTVGSFDTRRLFLAYAPDDQEWGDSFAAFETMSAAGPGDARDGEKSSFVGQLAWSGGRQWFRGVAALGSARFDFPGYLDQGAVEDGAYPYMAAPGVPLGRDRSSLGHVGCEFGFEVGDGALTLNAFASKTKMEMHEDLLDDDREQVNDATTIGLTTAYHHPVKLFSKGDAVEIGTYARIDGVDQSDTRLFADGTKNASIADATINATNVAGYVDLALHPLRRFVLRGGTRLDSLSYGVQDHAANAGLERTSQGMHAGGKVTADWLFAHGVHAIASYGDGFRSPEARVLREGDRVPFAVVHAVEGGVRTKIDKGFQASLVGFQSWLDRDRVFDAAQLSNVEAPSSERTGVAAVADARIAWLVSSTSVTYTHAVFTGSDARFADGDRVPYAPAFVLRNDTVASAKLGKLAGRRVTGRLGAGLQGAAGIALPPTTSGGRAGKDVFTVDALAAVSWRELELAVNGMNLLGLRYYDTQLVYGGSPHVLVAPPTSVFATLQIHLLAPKHADDDEQENVQPRAAMR